MTEPSSLIVDGVIYFHQNDEATLFDWLDRMAVVAGYVGRGDGLHLRLSRRPTDDVSTGSEIWTGIGVQRRATELA